MTNNKQTCPFDDEAFAMKLRLWICRMICPRSHRVVPAVPFVTMVGVCDTLPPKGIG